MATDDDDLLWPALDESRGPALPLDAAAARRIIDAALAPQDARVIPMPAASRRRRWRTPLLIAAALAAASVAAAAIYAGRRAPVTPVATPTAAPVSPAEVAPTSAVVPEAPSALDPPATSGEPAPSASPALRAPGRAISPRPVDPGALLQHANELRVQKKWREAEAAYRLVLQLAPTSPEAQTARISAADLRLHQLEDPGGAERLFDRAHEHGGALGEEAAYGLAEARRARGDREGETRALQQFLGAYPQSAMAARVRARLAELSTP